MAITVTTGGPINSIPPLSSFDNTFNSMIAEISDEADDTTGEYRAQIQKAILASIRYCERDVYYFNETRDVTFQTVAGQQVYDGSDNANIPTLIRIVEAYLEHSDGRRSWMRRVTPEEIEIVSDNSASRGEPYEYTYFNQQLYVYPIPAQQTYTIRLQLGPYRLTPIVNGDDTNVWLSEAHDLIKARAKYILYKDFLKDASLAAEALNDFNDQQTALKAETSRRNASGFIRVTCW